MEFFLNPVQARQVVIAALRSGRYKQTTHTLCRAEKDGCYHCILGVICEEFCNHEVEWIKNWQREIRINFKRKHPLHPDYLFGNTGSDLPEVVRNWIGFRTKSGNFNSTMHSISSLIRLNDLEGYTFEQFAVLLENPPRGLLVE